MESLKLPTINPFQTYPLEELIPDIIAGLVFLGGIFAVLAIVWAGVLFILSQGKDDRVKAASHIIKNVFFGIVMILVLLFLIPIAGNIIGLDMAQYATPGEIYARILRLSERLLSLNAGFFSPNGVPSESSSFF